MATGMQSWSTTASSNANADANVNWAEGMAPSQVNDSARAMMSSAAKWVSDNSGTLVTSGSSTAFTIATNQVEAALTDGYTVSAMLHTSPDANATLSVDGLAAKPIYTNTNAILVNQVLGNTIQRLTYSATYGAWFVQSFSAGVPVGAVTPFAGANSPGGWLLCDGTGYSQSSYGSLYTAIGTTYGSTGSGMFSVPDLRGRVPAGKEASPNLLAFMASNVLGTTGGLESETLTQSNMPVTGPTFTGATTVPVWNGNINTDASGGGTNFHAVFAGDLTQTLITGTVAGGSGSAFATVQPTIILNYIIYAGI